MIVLQLAPLLVVGWLAASASASDVVVRGRTTSLTIDTVRGVLVSLCDEKTGRVYATPPDAVESFRLTLVKPDKTKLNVIGKGLLPAKVEGSQKDLAIHWASPMHDTAGEPLDISATMRLRAVGDGVEVTFQVRNGTNCTIEEARYPIVGSMGSIGNGDAVLWAPTTNPWQRPLGPAAFGYPGQLCMSFTCVQSKSSGRSLYFASQDTVARYKTYRFEELQPGCLSASVSHTPFTGPGRSFVGSPVMMKFVDGDWRAAGKAYRSWFKRAFGIVDPAKCWIRNESFFHMLMFMLPEGTINLRFQDIPKWAKAAKACGIDSVQISGWQIGGHDNGYPYYSPDPRLGTYKDLEDGIRACHKLGMKVYFFVNYQPAMLQSDWYKHELQKFREVAADGGLTWNTGWGMGTLAARMGHSKNMTWLDPAFPQVRKIIVGYFAKLAQIGADGVHVDKMFPSAIEYNSNAPLGPDTATWEGAVQLTKEIYAACRQFKPNWAMSFECNWDRLLQFTGATWWVGNELITRQIFPENAETLGLYDAWDFLKVNDAVRDGHIVMVSPMGFSRALDWEPFRELGAYIREIKHIRGALADSVFLGEVEGHAGIDVKPEPGVAVQYNVFRNRKTGRRVCIATNSSLSPASLRIERFSQGAGYAWIRQPFKAAALTRLPVTVEIPAERIVFVEQTPAPEFVPLDQNYEPHALLTELAAKGRPVDKPLPNGDFETGDFKHWKADPTWTVANDWRGYYSGWQSRHWAWSGGNGERATGKLTSEPFKLERDGVKLLITGWNSLSGTGKPRKWNYVTLNLANGKELDRVYAPNTTVFVSAFLDGSNHRGQAVYIQAVDDADEATYSMIGIDDVRQADLPGHLKLPLSRLPRFNPQQTQRFENDAFLLEFSRKNGALTRLRNKALGIELIREPRLGDSFKFALPIPGKEIWQTIEANWIFGRDQKPPAISVRDAELTIAWKGPLRNYLGQPYDVDVVETVRLEAAGPVWEMAVNNRSKLPVGETYFPIVGGLQGLGSTRTQLRATELVRPAGDGAVASADIFRVFTNMSWLGDQGPEQFYAYPESQPEPWAGFASDKLQTAVGFHQTNDRKTVIRLELVPAGSGTTRDDGNWPRPAELRRLPCGVALSFVDVVGGPGEVYRSAPVALRWVRGGPNELRHAFQRAILRQ